MAALVKIGFLNTKKEAKREPAAAAVSTKGGRELAGRKKLPRAPCGSMHPYPPRPAFLGTQMPQLYVLLYGDKTFECLSRKQPSSLKNGQLCWHQSCATYTLLRASLDRAASAHRAPEAPRAKLAFVEEKDYKNSDVFVAELIFNPRLQEFDVQAVIISYVTAHLVAKSVGRFPDRVRRDQGGAGGNLTSSSLSNQAGRRIGRGSNLWRIVHDVGWLNAFCRKSRCKMETLKKLRDLAEQHDWCFSFDCQDATISRRSTRSFRNPCNSMSRASCINVAHSPSLTVLVEFMKWEGRGLRANELGHLHITHLEPEAVDTTVQAFLRELTGKATWLYCDNEAVDAMLLHFTSRRPDLMMRRMRRLWRLPDLHATELQALYNKSEANKWVVRLSHDLDLDDWKLTQRRFDWGTAAALDWLVKLQAAGAGGKRRRGDMVDPTNRCAAQLLEAVSREGHLVRIGHGPGQRVAPAGAGQCGLRASGGETPLGSQHQEGCSDLRQGGGRDAGAGVLPRWSQLSSAMQACVDPTAMPDQAMLNYVGWLRQMIVCRSN
ncbi:hypothetical protein CYMTET_11046 [Cymbomonas tetramitiformis]|uniref:Uncharacterized protein n=1 Tax=Cymbomonas tetramitiformis TaxID=36881 RepID=A0AAE0LD76_9CHLO|nr:hypothetical protein CYMTET_11046 [Cymbomonas tetramitiformis]